MGKAQLEELNKSGRYFSVPKGVSMRPMIESKRDIIEIRKPERPVKRYDLVLYIRGDEQGVIHRVLHVREKYCVIAGDNCWRKEYVPHDKIVGVAVSFCRKGKWHDVDYPPYKLYVRLWTDLFFIRRPLFYLRDMVKRKLRKLKREKQQ